MKRELEVKEKWWGGGGGRMRFQRTDRERMRLRY